MRCMARVRKLLSPWPALEEMSHASTMHSESPACLWEIAVWLRLLLIFHLSAPGFIVIRTIRRFEAHATKDTALQMLAPALVPCLMRKLAPQLSTERLDVMWLGFDPQRATSERFPTFRCCRRNKRSELRPLCSSTISSVLGKQ